MNLNAFFCENLDIFKNNEGLSVLQYDLHSFKIRQQSITPYLFEETKILILPIIEDKRSKHYITDERRQESKILILPIIEDKRPKH